MEISNTRAHSFYFCKMTQAIESLFPSFEKELLNEIVEKGEWKMFKSEEKLMRTGQYFRSILLILEGLIKVYREDAEGNEFFMYYLQPGQACALSMKCPERMEKSEIMARVIDDTTIIAVPFEYMDAWMHQYKSWYHFVMDTYRKRVEELLITIDDIAFRKMDERLLSYFKKAKQIYNSSMLTINHTELAEELNSSREVVSRLIKKLSEKGMIRLHKNQQVEVIDLQLLEKDLY
jgi:CRP/FNR family transcriptional regulator, anaerobic regulatory protein